MVYSGSLASDDLHEIPFQPVLSQMPYLESLTSEHLFQILRDFFRPDCLSTGDESIDTLSFERPIFFCILHHKPPLFFPR